MQKKEEIAMKNIAEMDKNMAIKKPAESDEKDWHSPAEKPAELSGFAFFDTDRRYCRIPFAYDKIMQKVNPNVCSLAKNPSGGQIRFISDSSSLSVRVTLDTPADMGHMPATGQCGFDAYLRPVSGGEWVFAGISRYDHTLKEYTSEIFSGLPPENREFLLHFPLYKEVKEVSIGLDKGASLLPPSPRKEKGRIVWYGTSIAQGGCAARPGMSFTNILSRRLDVEIINLGFSGNGLGEPEMAEICASVPDKRVFVMDYDANAGARGLLEETLDPFLDVIRRADPALPILVISAAPVPDEKLKPEVNRNRKLRRDFQKRCVKRRRAEGDINLHYLDGRDLWGADYCEFAVDGVHPTDLGFYEMSKTLYPVLKNFL